MTGIEALQVEDVMDKIAIENKKESYDTVTMSGEDTIGILTEEQIKKTIPNTQASQRIRF